MSTGSGAHLIAAGPGTDEVGALSVGSGGFVNLGATLGLPQSPVANLHVNGSVTFASGSGLAEDIDAAGTTAGVDYGEFTATGNIALNGASFGMDDDAAGCPTDSEIGDTFPLVSTPGTISGVFAGAGDL